MAIYHIGKALLNDMERNVGVILYDPQQGGPSGVIGTHTRIAPDGSLYSPRSIRTKEHASFRPKRPMGNNENFQDNNGETITKNLNINADMVGCVIGRGGSFISHIRRVSGARLHVSEQQGSSTERTVTIMGTDDAVNKAMKLLYAQLESEKERREQLASEKSGVVQ